MHTGMCTRRCLSCTQLTSLNEALAHMVLTVDADWLGRSRRRSEIHCHDFGVGAAEIDGKAMEFKRTAVGIRLSVFTAQS